MANNWFHRLHSRYVLECTLDGETGLHVGAGMPSQNADSPFIRDGQGCFIPGSSIRGSLRSTAERLAWVLFPGESAYCTSFRPAVAGCDRELSAEVQDKRVASGRFRVCPLCGFFGSTAMAARFKVSDARQAATVLQEPLKRDGVGIDRDTETASSRIKYDFEVLEKGCRFNFTMQLENGEPDDFALLYLLLTEMQNGFEVGGKRSRGLGRCKLSSYEVRYFDQSNGYPLESYLRERKLAALAAKKFENTVLAPAMQARINGGDGNAAIRD